MYGNLSSLNIRLTGPDLEPDDDAWRRAADAERRAYWAYLGSSALGQKRSELDRGIDADGNDLKSVKWTSRPDGAGGPPLSPHDAASRTQKLLAMTSTARGATLYWRAGWKTILGYHAVMRGPRSLPVRDVFGLSPGGIAKVVADAASYWRRAAAGRSAAAEATLPPMVPSAGAILAGDAVVTIDLGRALADLARDGLYFVRPGGGGASKPGSYAGVASRIAAGLPTDMPRVGLDAAGRITVIDGRHTLARLAELGLPSVPVTVPAADAARLLRRYGAGPPALPRPGVGPTNLSRYTLHSGSKSAVARAVRAGTFTGFRKLPSFVEGR